MKFIKSKKGIAMLATLVVVGASAFGAYAYFTSTGTGSGTATVGATGNNIYVTSTTTGTLYPTATVGEDHALSFTAYNYSTFTQAISSIHATSIAACEAAWSAAGIGAGYPPTAPTCADTGLAATSDAACDTSLSTAVANPGGGTAAFWIPDNTFATAVDLPAATNATTPSSTALTADDGTIAMNDTGANQDACQSKNLLISYTTG
jgi:hypothetical protein